VSVTSTSPSGASAPEPTASPTPGAGLATAELDVVGMHCGACVALIEESLTEQAGVATAAVDLESARAVVHYDPALVGPDDLRAAVAEAGYSATAVG
jgi:copper chaperone CopZ